MKTILTNTKHHNGQAIIELRLLESQHTAYVQDSSEISRCILYSTGAQYECHPSHNRLTWSTSVSSEEFLYFELCINDEFIPFEF